MINIIRFFYAWFIPPGLFLLTFLFSYYLFYKTGESYWFLIVFIEIYLLSIQPIADALIKPLENYYKQIPVSEIKGAKAIVVLTGNYNRKKADFNGEGQISFNAANRFIMCLRLHNALHLPIIISGTIKETLIAARTLKSCGVKEQDILIEGNSRNTAENAFFTNQLCRQKEYNKILLVTTACHLPRSVAFFRREGLTVIPYPADYRSNHRNKHELISFAPSHYILSNSAAAIKEYLGIIAFKINFQ